MQDFFRQRKRAIESELADFFGRRRGALEQQSPGAALVADRLLAYAVEGKMIRGGLVGLLQGLYGGVCGREAARLGAVMELFQSALLIHDDIMDRDSMRRGKPAMHTQFGDDISAAGGESPERTGEALGICVGDIAFFLGYEILSELEVGDSVRGRLFGLCSREMTGVGLGQMQDIRAGSLPQVPRIDEIYSIYINKTGRYTFSLPMMAGAMLGGADDGQLADLSRLGEILGIIFQIKDDELGLFGSQEEIGKPVGTDLCEGKQTLFYAELMSRLPIHERERVSALKGAESVPQETIDFVRRRLHETGVMEDTARRIAQLTEQAEALIDGLPLEGSEYGPLMRRFVAYNLERTV